MKQLTVKYVNFENVYPVRLSTDYREVLAFNEYNGREEWRKPYECYQSGRTGNWYVLDEMAREF